MILFTKTSVCVQRNLFLKRHFFSEDRGSMMIVEMYFNRWCIKTIGATSWQNQQNGMCARKDSDQPGHRTSLIWVFAVRMKKAWVFSYPLSAQRRLWSDWADAQADQSLHWVHMPFCWFCHEAALELRWGLKYHKPILLALLWPIILVLTAFILLWPNVLQWKNIYQFHGHS